MHERGWVELAHAPQIEWAPLPAEGWPMGVQARVLSRDAADGALTAVVRLPAGYRRPLGHHGAALEVLISSGALRIGDEVHGHGWFGFLPAGVTSSPWTAETEVELLLCARTGSPDFRPEPGPVASHEGVIAIDTMLVDWTAAPAWERLPVSGVTMSLASLIDRALMNRASNRFASSMRAV